MPREGPTVLIPPGLGELCALSLSHTPTELWLARWFQTGTLPLFLAYLGFGPLGLGVGGGLQAWSLAPPCRSLHTAHAHAQEILGRAALTAGTQVHS